MLCLEMYKLSLLTEPQAHSTKCDFSKESHRPTITNHSSPLPIPESLLIIFPSLAYHGSLSFILPPFHSNPISSLAVQLLFSSLPLSLSSGGGGTRREHGIGKTREAWLAVMLVTGEGREGEKEFGVCVRAAALAL